MSDPIPFETLVDYATGALDAAAAKRLEETLTPGSAGATIVARIRGVVDGLGDPALEDAPPRAVRRAREIPARVASSPEVREQLERLGRGVARLVFDSRAAGAVAGFRSARDAAQVSYMGPLGRVDIRIAAGEGGQRRLQGQFDGHGAHRALVAYLVGGTERELPDAVPVDTHGRFQLRTVPGVYDLVIEFKDRTDELIVPDLAIE